MWLGISTGKPVGTTAPTYTHIHTLPIPIDLQVLMSMDTVHGYAGQYLQWVYLWVYWWLYSAEGDVEVGVNAGEMAAVRMMVRWGWEQQWLRQQMLCSLHNQISSSAHSGVVQGHVEFLLVSLGWWCEDKRSVRPKSNDKSKEVFLEGDLVIVIVWGWGLIFSIVHLPLLTVDSPFTFTIHVIFLADTFHYIVW